MTLIVNFAIIITEKTKGVTMDKLSLDYLSNLYLFAKFANKIEATNKSALVLQAVESLPFYIINDSINITLQIIHEVETFLLTFAKKDFK